jgi:hypothetical protein
VAVCETLLPSTLPGVVISILLGGKQRIVQAAVFVSNPGCLGLPAKGCSHTVPHSNNQVEHAGCRRGMCVCVCVCTLACFCVANLCQLLL